jgi:hypothetical protein
MSCNLSPYVEAAFARKKAAAKATTAHRSITPVNTGLSFKAALPGVPDSTTPARVPPLNPAPAAAAPPAPAAKAEPSSTPTSSDNMEGWEEVGKPAKEPRVRAVRAVRLATHPVAGRKA